MVKKNVQTCDQFIVPLLFTFHHLTHNQDELLHVFTTGTTVKTMYADLSVCGKTRMNQFIIIILFIFHCLTEDQGRKFCEEKFDCSARAEPGNVCRLG